MLHAVLALLVAAATLLGAVDVLVAAPCTSWAAPIREDGGRVPPGRAYALPEHTGSRLAPIAVADFWERGLATPGSVLCLTDGEYRGARSMIVPPADEFVGRPFGRIEIRAENDGGAWLDGEFKHKVARLRGHHYWTLSGLNLSNSTGPVLSVGGTRRDHGGREDPKDQTPIHDVVIRRVVAWRDFVPYGTREDYDRIGGKNLNTIAVVAAEDVLVEDSAAFGWARKIIGSYRSHRITFRRTWARWDGRWPYTGMNLFTYTCSYKTYDALCENVLATAGGSFDPAAYPAEYDPPITLIATDGSAKKRDLWVRPVGRDRHDIGLRILGSLAYAVPGRRIPRASGLRIGGAEPPNKGKKGVLVANTVAAIPPTGTQTANLFDCDDDPAVVPEGCSWNEGRAMLQAPLRLSHVTLIGGSKRRPARLHKDWQREDLVEKPWEIPVDIYTPTAGAALCKRSHDGHPTKVPLWPWPMQERIKLATERSNWPTADVMADINTLFGPPPAECTAGTEPPTDVTP